MTHFQISSQGEDTTIDSHERLTGALAILMDEAGHQFLPSACFSLDEDREVRVGHRLDLLAEAMYSEAMPHKIKNALILLNIYSHKETFPIIRLIILSYAHNT